VSVAPGRRDTGSILYQSCVARFVHRGLSESVPQIVEAHIGP